MTLRREVHFDRADLKHQEVFWGCEEVELQEDGFGSLNHDTVVFKFAAPPITQTLPGNPWPTILVYRIIQGLCVQTRVGEEEQK